MLIDNDGTVSEVNQKIVKATLKYMFYHKRDDRTFCVNTYEHDILSAEEYTDDVNDLVCTVDTLEYAPKDSNLCDTVSEVITRWRAADFACRDILVFSDGLEGEATEHEREELYYLLENSGYPVYVVMLDQENNTAARKPLSAIATTSGGKLFETDFDGSDAEVDRQLTDMIFASMDEYALVHWKKYEEEYDDAGDTKESTPTADEEATETEEYIGEEEYIESEDYDKEAATEGIIYEYDRTPGFFESPGALVLSAVLIVAGLTAGILGGFIIVRKRRTMYAAAKPVCEDEDDLFEDYELKNMGAEDDTGATVIIDDCEGTRLLEQEGRIVTLADRRDGRTYRIALCSRMSIGRASCDVTIRDDALSKCHCELYEDEGDVYVKDMGSSNGTWVNNVRVSAMKLECGDLLTIGTGKYTVEIE